MDSDLIYTNSFDPVLFDIELIRPVGFQAPPRRRTARIDEGEMQAPVPASSAAATEGRLDQHLLEVGALELLGLLVHQVCQQLSRQ